MLTNRATIRCHLLAQRGVYVEFILVVFVHLVQHDNSIGIVDTGSVHEALNLVTHVIGVSELADRDESNPPATS